MRTIIAVLLVANVAGAVWLWRHPGGQGEKPAAEVVPAGQVAGKGMGAPLVLLGQDAEPPIPRDSLPASDAPMDAGEAAQSVPQSAVGSSQPGAVTQPLDTATPKPAPLPDGDAAAAAAPPSAGVAGEPQAGPGEPPPHLSKVAAPAQGAQQAVETQGTGPPAAPAQAITAAEGCIKLVGFSDKRVAEALLGRLRDQAGVNGGAPLVGAVLDESTQVDRHWVYVPVLTEQGTAPLPERLSQAGFTDHLEMRTDDGSRVVSLGVFRSAGAARRLAARLQAAGFDAHLVIRPQRVARYALRVVAKSPRQAALIGSQRLTDGVRREVCPAG